MVKTILQHSNNFNISNEDIVIHNNINIHAYEKQLLKLVALLVIVIIITPKYKVNILVLI